MSAFLFPTRKQDYFFVRRLWLFHRCVRPPLLHLCIVVSASCLLASPCIGGGVHDVVYLMPDRRSLPTLLPTLFGRPVGTPRPPHSIAINIYTCRKEMFNLII